MNADFDPDRPIQLAHEADFALGRCTVRPATRELVCGAATEVLEPRVMQVLVALARAHGAVVSRDDLTLSCWEGRVVGEDAINRVMSRLRRVAEGIGAGSFRIETVTKVGYRLIVAAHADAALSIDQTANGTSARRPTRRTLLAFGGLLAAGGAAAGLWRVAGKRRDENPLTGQAASLSDEAFVLLGQDTPDAGAQAIGLFRRVVELAPGAADAWGALAIAYSRSADLGDRATAEAMAQRAAAAADRATALEPANAYAQCARAALLPVRGNWQRIEQAYGAALSEHGDERFALAGLAIILSMVGRCRESAALFDRLVAAGRASPGVLYLHFAALMASNRLDEADNAADRAFRLYPTHAGIWFNRFYLLLYTGRADQALAFGRQGSGRPLGIPDRDFALILAVAQAMVTRAATDIDAAVAMNLAAAREGSGFARNAMEFCAALGRADEAFMLADALYFGRGFAVPEYDFSPQQGLHTRIANRPTSQLFAPSTAAMRADPRFSRLTTELGLERYWKDASVQPDYRRYR